MALYGRLPDKSALQGAARIPEDKLYGLGWPVGEDSNQAYFNKASKDELIRAQVKQILLTRRGERVMLPTFGVGLDDYLFAPLTSELANNIAFEIRDAIANFAPNIEVVKVVSKVEENYKGFGLPGLVVNLTVKEKKYNNLVDVGITV